MHEADVATVVERGVGVAAGSGKTELVLSKTESIVVEDRRQRGAVLDCQTVLVA